MPRGMGPSARMIGNGGGIHGSSGYRIDIEIPNFQGYILGVA